jgi:large subunit ribosomal protein L28
MVTGTGVLVGRNVSHANNKTKRRFLPNLQAVSLLSDSLGRRIRLRVSTRGLKTVEKRGGLDAWLLGTPPAELDANLRRLKRVIAKAQAQRSA